MADPTGPSGADAIAALAGFLDSFDSRTRSRGRSYYKEGHVGLLAPTGSVVQAVVRGSRDYEVTLIWEQGCWVSDCSCPVEVECKHAYAAGMAWLRRHDGTSAQPAATMEARRPPVRLVRPEDEALIVAYTHTAGYAPNTAQLKWLRHLAALHRSLPRDAHSSWIDFSPLIHLAPPLHRHRLPHSYQNPFAGWWQKTPATPLDLWPFVALLFTELRVPLPNFTATFDRIEAARAARDAARREAALAEWRQRFTQLDAAAAKPVFSQSRRQALRLRLGPKKWTWELSPEGPDGPFAPLPGRALQDMLTNLSWGAIALDDAGNAFLAYLRANQQIRGRTALSPENFEDCKLLGHLLEHPAIRPRLVAAAGEPLTEDPRPLTWRVDDHPDDPTRVSVQLAFADGTPLPAPLLYVPAHPAHVRYLAPNGALFRGPPPPREPTAQSSRDGFHVELPRAALALPEASRFAARAGLKLPGDVSGRYRAEPLRARFRARIAPRREDNPISGEVLVIELHALAPGNEARARWSGAGWSTAGKELVRPADAAFLLHDYGPLQPAVDHLGRFHGLWFDGSAPGGGRHSSEITSGGFAFDFANWLAGVPADVLVELDPDLAAFAAPPTRAHFALEIEESGIDWFDVRVKLQVEDTTLTPEEIALLRRAKGRFIRLPGRGWRRLEIAADPGAQAGLDRLGLQTETLADDPGRDAQKFHALQLADEALGEAMPARLAARIRARAHEIRTLPVPPLPVGLQAELRPYQVEGFHFLAQLAENNFGGVLADDMGLGKTLQALAWLLRLGSLPASAPRPLRALVVCPKSVVFNWETETARFAPSLQTGRILPRATAPVPPGVNLVIVNYAQLRLHASALAAEQWDAAILDEGQNIKNPASATAAAARALPAKHRLVLTGTPVENRLLDLWSLFAFAQPGLLGGQAAFKRLYNDRADPAAAHARLARRVRHFMLRRTKTQVARDLPARTEEEIVVELEGVQRKLYDAELKRARQLLLGVEDERTFSARRFNILQSLLRLRQICCDPRLLGAELEAGSRMPRKSADAEPAAPTAVSAKLEALLDTLEPLLAEGHRVLVFSQFVTMLELIRTELAAREIRYLLLTGQTENRQELVEQFQAPDGPPVFLLSLKAAGAGLNLTAASYVVLYDPWWNPAVEAQAIDRTHRIGQSAHVIAYRLLARDTVEEKIRALQKEKAALAAAVVQEESLARVLDLESLRRILA